MSDASTIARRQRALTAEEIRILNWMEANGHPGYWTEVRVLQDLFSEIVGEAGPGGNHCELTQARLDKIEADIMETTQAAIDRFEDWRTDPFD